MNDDTACAILGRDAPRAPWYLIAFSSKTSVAIRSAEQTAAQERFLGRPAFMARVMRRQDWEDGKNTSIASFGGKKVEPGAASVGVPSGKATTMGGNADDAR